MITTMVEVEERERGTDGKGRAGVGGEQTEKERETKRRIENNCDI